MIVDAPAAALSPAQLKAALWSDADQRVYALVRGRCIAGLPARLDQAQADAELDDFDCLRPGALSAAERAAAPWLVQLKRDSALTDWLLFAAERDHGAQREGGWGLIVRSALPFLALRAHARELCQARLPDGRTIALEWMDPEVLQALLASAAPDQLDRVFAGVDELVIAGATQWRHASAALGQLQWRTSAVQGDSP
jgi:hypothetical protein